jgi:DNA-binding MarR family transcriptional regulator
VAGVDMRRRLDTALEQQLGEAGLSSADFQLLVPLSEAPDDRLRARDLGKAGMWDRSRLSHQLRRMEQRGLICRCVCPEDARGTHGRAYPAGRAAVEAAAPGHIAATSALRRPLSAEDVETLGDVFVRVRDGLMSWEPSCAVTNETTR